MQLGSILGRCQLTARAVYYSASLSWLLALVSQVLPLCGLLNKSLASCPFSWQGHGPHPSVSPRPSFCSGCRRSIPTPPCPPYPQVWVPFSSPGAGWAPVTAVYFVGFTLQLRILEPDPRRGFQAPHEQVVMPAWGSLCVMKPLRLVRLSFKVKTTQIHLFWGRRRWQLDTFGAVC